MAVSLYFKQKDRFVTEENIQAGKEGKTEERKGGRKGGRRRPKREEKNPLEHPLSPLGVCGLLNCGLLFQAAASLFLQPGTALRHFLTPCLSEGRPQNRGAGLTAFLPQGCLGTPMGSLVIGSPSSPAWGEAACRGQKAWSSLSSQNDGCVLTFV